MAEMPKAFVGGDEGFHASAAVSVGDNGSAGQQVFDYLQQLLGDIVIGLIAGVMEGDQDLVRQAAAVARRRLWAARGRFGLGRPGIGKEFTHDVAIVVLMAAAISAPVVPGWMSLCSRPSGPIKYRNDE